MDRTNRAKDIFPHPLLLLPVLPRHSPFLSPNELRASQSTARKAAALADT